MDANKTNSADCPMKEIASVSSIVTKRDSHEPRERSNLGELPDKDTTVYENFARLRPIFRSGVVTISFKPYIPKNFNAF